MLHTEEMDAQKLKFEYFHEKKLMRKNSNINGLFSNKILHTEEMDALKFKFVYFHEKKLMHKISNNSGLFSN